MKITMTKKQFHVLTVLGSLIIALLTALLWATIQTCVIAFTTNKKYDNTLWMHEQSRDRVTEMEKAIYHRFNYHGEWPGDKDKVNPWEYKYTFARFENRMNIVLGRDGCD